MEEVGVGGVGVPGHLGSTGENRPGGNFESFFGKTYLEPPSWRDRGIHAPPRGPKIAVVQVKVASAADSIQRCCGIDAEKKKFRFLLRSGTPATTLLGETGKTDQEIKAFNRLASPGYADHCHSHCWSGNTWPTTLNTGLPTTTAKVHRLNPRYFSRKLPKTKLPLVVIQLFSLRLYTC